MSIAIISAQTGNGHFSVMETLAKEFKQQGASMVDCYPTFYEDMMVSNKILSNFYNFLMVNSIALCNQYCEFTYLTRYDLSEDFYNGVRNFVIQFLQKKQYDVIISVTHTINHVMMRIIRELGLSTKYVIVVTDPFDPIAVGFDVPGADQYYCANEIIRDVLLRKKIDADKINIAGYPINDAYFFNDKKVSQNKTPTILINSGAQGIQMYYKFLDILCTKTNYKIIFICGRNNVLYQRSKRYIQKHNLEDRVELLSFVSNTQEYLAKADIEITKAGANTFFEALAMQLPMIIYTEEILFQEKGVQQFVSKYRIGELLESIEKCPEIIEKVLNNYDDYKNNITALHITNGAERIVKSIMEL